jgi:diacylglycerol kinase (ATP)
MQLPAHPSSPRSDRPPYPVRQGLGFWHSMIHAWRGLIHTVVHQRNMRVHVVSGILVGLVGSGIPLGLAEKVTLIFCVLFIFFAEILNSALEELVDLAIQELDERARLTKDATAAGVLVLAIGTMVIFAAILVHNWGTVASHGPEIQRQVILGVPLALCAAGLMMNRPKPLGVDILLFVVGLGLIGLLAEHSESYVFTAMTFGLLVVAGAAALEQRRLRVSIEAPASATTGRAGAPSNAGAGTLQK